MTDTPTQTDTPAPPRKIAILGYAPSVRLAPWNDPTWELWCLNDMPWTQPRCDVLFEIHRPEVIKAEGHWDKLKALTIPIYMQERYPEIPTSIKYPLDYVQQRYTVPGRDRAFLTCSASQMLAVAVDSVPTPAAISLFGVDMLMDNEFGWQRPSCEFWLGVCVGRNIALTLQPQTDLLNTRFIYGYEDEKQAVFDQQLNEREKWLQDQVQIAVNQESAAKETRLQYAGALADLLYVKKRYAF